jgi:hypothetical protein
VLTNKYSGARVETPPRFKVIAIAQVLLMLLTVMEKIETYVVDRVFALFLRKDSNAMIVAIGILFMQVANNGHKPS